MGLGHEHAHKVIPLILLLELVSTFRILRKHRSRNVVKSRILTVLGGIFRCEEIKQRLERDGCRDIVWRASGCRARRVRIFFPLFSFPSGASSSLRLLVKDFFTGIKKKLRNAPSAYLHKQHHRHYRPGHVLPKTHRLVLVMLPC